MQHHHLDASFLPVPRRKILHRAPLCVRFSTLFGRKNLRQSDGLHFISDSLRPPKQMRTTPVRICLRRSIVKQNSPGKKPPCCFFCSASIPQGISFGKSFYYKFLICLTNFSYNSSDTHLIHGAMPRTQPHRASAPAPPASAACSHVREGAPFPKSRQRPPRTS